MSQLDPEMAARVWQRVRQGQEPELARLAWEELADAERLRQLSGLLRGQAAQSCRQLEQQARSRAGCLRGLAMLEDSSFPPAGSAAPALHGRDSLLRGCCKGHLERGQKYAALAETPRHC